MGRATLKRELGGIALALFAVFAAGALVWAGRTPSGASCWAAQGAFGPVGACLRWTLVTLVGLPAAALVPALSGLQALRLFHHDGDALPGDDRSWLRAVGGAALIAPVAIALALGAPRALHPLAGIWGAFVGYYLQAGFGFGGAWLVLLLATSALTAWALAWNPLRLVVGPRPASQSAHAAAAVLGGAPGDTALGEEPYAPPKRRRKRGEPASDAATAALLEPTPEEMPAIDPTLMGDGLAASGKKDERLGKKRGRGTGDNEVIVAAPNPAAPAGPRGDKVLAEMSAAQPEPSMLRLPTADMLTQPKERNVELSRKELDAAGARLMDALRTFRIEGQLVGRTVGPTVTQFEIEPAPGVKVRQIATLTNDLALAMRAPSIRIVAPIPGKGAVGVEVPNPTPEMVYFRSIVESAEFREAKAALPIALGKDLEGKPVVADLAKMPHLLVAGATGAGKSVCINTIITSLIFRHTPKSLRFLMVDPKMVELSVYNELPHLRHKVITDNRDAASVLKWAVMEMQDRYALLAENGCRNIQDFNRRVREGNELRRPRNPDVAFENRAYAGGELPYIVVIIDEMADLMMTVQGEVETPIAMLAQKARAIGIHLILATQRPSVNVITGLIKANFPSRIAFRVASQVDSRTIIDGAGAETLLGNGDMLFIPPGKSEPSRLQGAYLSTEETERLMGWYRDAREGTSEEARQLAETFDKEPDILETVRQREQQESGGAKDDGDAGDEDRDKLFREAAEVCIQNQLGSTSLLQRRLKIGYGRAARIIDQLHAAGVLGPPDGSKPRDVLKNLMDLEEICGAKV